MEIKLDGNYFLDDFKTFFGKDHNVSSYSPVKDYDKHIDLFVFTGGADVSLFYYCDREEEIRFSEFVTSSPERDKREFQFFTDIRDGKIKTTKVLGVCRGMQFLNVAFGGALYPDLRHYRKEHNYVHRIIHNGVYPLSFLKNVNSLHHQGVSYIGTGAMSKFFGKEIRTYLWSYEPDSGVPEVITWGNRYLGLQFHPEMYADWNPDKEKIRDVIIDWVNGKEF